MCRKPIRTRRWQIKRWGDAALKAKDYATVVTKYGEYLKQNNYQDTARIFNCGYAANQAKNYAEAAKYFDMAVKMNYNVDDSYVGEAMAYRNLNKTEEFLTTVKEGLKVIPDGNKNKTNLEKLLYGYCIKQGQAAQKKGDLAGAEKMYKEVLAVSNKDYQSNAYYSLGAMLYGNGAKILQAATRSLLPSRIIQRRESESRQRFQDKRKNIWQRQSNSTRKTRTPRRSSSINEHPEIKKEGTYSYKKPPGSLFYVIREVFCI